MLDIDYREFLSLDNGKGLLGSKGDVEVLSLYGFNYCDYSNISDLVFDVDNYLNSTYEELEDLEEVLVRISDINYYVNTKK